MKVNYDDLKVTSDIKLYQVFLFIQLAKLPDKEINIQEKDIYKNHEN